MHSGNPVLRAHHKLNYTTSFRPASVTQTYVSVSNEKQNNNNENQMQNYSVFSVESSVVMCSPKSTGDQTIFYFSGIKNKQNFELPVQCFLELYNSILSVRSAVWTWRADSVGTGAYFASKKTSA